MNKHKNRAGSEDNRVLIKRCDPYDAAVIRDIIITGMRELDYRPAGKIFVKPNVVYATSGGKYGSTAYTAPAVVEGALWALGNMPGVARIDMGEKTAIGYPTRLVLKYSGYYRLIRRLRKSLKIPVPDGVLKSAS